MAFQQGLSGLNAASKSLDVIGNNIANANTTGFKSSRAEFADMVASAMGAAGGGDDGIGVYVADVAQQFAQGNLNITNNKLDLAIEGNGFFRIKLPSGVDAFTRAGNFQVDKSGNLVTNEGASVLDNSGAAISLVVSPLTSPTEITDVNIGANGVITVYGPTGAALTGPTIGLANFPNLQGLKPIGGNNWVETDASGTILSGLAKTGTPSTSGFGVLKSGALEESNVDLTGDLVNLMTAQRYYQANAQTIKTQDQVMSTLVNLR
ncbi:MAG: flagellar hook basal-body protein [Burkholderiaceae bacterium]|nr:flagellar hook basal-body protein [Burkholderiaceae bacterium]